MEFSTSDEANVVIVGGMLRPSELSLIGFITDQALKEVRVNKVIMGITAISVAAGLSNDHLPEVMTDRAIFSMAPEVILVADHTKLGRVASGFVAPLTRVTTLITDCEADLEIVQQVRGLGVQVIVVSGDKNGR
jgi:DeoR/GlpR family transcriptional regulator of sugar metabolism